MLIICENFFDDDMFIYVRELSMILILMKAIR